MSEYPLISDRLKNAREYVGLSLETVSRFCDFSLDELEQIEDGVKRISKDQLDRFAKLYMHPIEFFYNKPENLQPIQLLARATDDLTDMDREQIERFSKLLIEVGKAR